MRRSARRGTAAGSRARSPWEHRNRPSGSLPGRSTLLAFQDLSKVTEGGPPEVRIAGMLLPTVDAVEVRRNRSRGNIAQVRTRSPLEEFATADLRRLEEGFDALVQMVGNRDRRLHRSPPRSSHTDSITTRRLSGNASVSRRRRPR